MPKDMLQINVNWLGSSMCPHTMWICLGVPGHDLPSGHLRMTSEDLFHDKLRVLCFVIYCHVFINIIACLSYCMICVIFFLHIIEVTSPSLNLTWDLSKSNLYGFLEMDESIHWREQITRNDTSQVHCEIGPLKTTPAAECWALNVANTVNKAEWIFALECAHWA